MMTELDKLKNLVELDSDNENACRDALLPLSKHLVKDSNLKFERGEYIHSDGRVDLLLVVKPFTTLIPGSPELVLNDGIVFELKSPKKPLFQFDNKSKRFLPSYELILAETQLLNYIQSLEENSGDLFFKYQVKKVKVGGIIMGRDKTKFLPDIINIKNAGTEPELNNEKRLSLHARTNLLYETSRLSLFTWDEIIKLIETNSTK